jgi:hypothetical protein
LALLLVAFFATTAEAATLTTQIARVREYLYQTDSSNSTYTDTQITEAIKESMTLLENLLSYSARQDNINTATMSYDTGSVLLYSGTTSVYLPSYFGKIIALYDSTGKPYIQIKPEEAFRTRTATTKDPVFIMLNGIFYIYPAPTSSGTLTMIYSKRYFISIDASATISVEEKHINKLTLAAVWYILQADNQQARAANIYKLLTDLVTIENNALVNTNVIERVQGGK